MNELSERHNDGPKPLPPPGYLTRFADVDASKRKLPHWEHPGVAAFVTFRLGDSLPEERMSALRMEIDEWRAGHSDLTDETLETECAKRFRARLESLLDVGYGSCIFASEESRRVVEDSLRFYDGKRIALYGYVVMPNHVHLLFMPLEGETIQSIVRDVKHYASGKLRHLKCWAGSFWQREHWDTLIRDEEHFVRVLAYIRGNNPAIAYDAYVHRGAMDPLER